ncbi:RWD domain-containing protein [Copromyces sp. CBS 386.78]|uniref:RWD domain-containing protein n=1 Tax=Pseudoneurospora amorphoporcata TaxID=241081 RepID=A0AAN6P272_9PEZI|nr:RWD domain-containing protein [Copromyces sp. CBS 386.78]KAK3956380.1 RWD domain-containing protein [Pseudoneurospora amorphoporcata]
MGREEQIEEREVLDSIFPDEIQDISDTEYRISIALDIPDDKAEEPPSMVLTVRYPEDYPDKPPSLELAPAPNAPPHEFINIAEDRFQLLEGVQETIEENLGMAMIFTVVSTLKDAAEQLAVERRDAAIKAQEEAAQAAEREENKKFQGTPVNRETFLKWRDNFMQELEDQRIKEEEEKAAEMKKARIKEPVKLTGKQLWERGLAKGGDEDLEGDDDMPVEEVQKLTV